MGQIFVEGQFLQKMVIFFQTLMAHYSHIFHSRGITFAFLDLSRYGHPKNIRCYAYFPFSCPFVTD